MTRILAIALGLAALAAAGVARADGLPVLGVDVGGKGVVGPGGGRYVTIPAGRDTIVAHVGRDGRIFRSRLLSGAYTIPAVAYDGSASGLSADGETLVLIRPRAQFPRERTPLVVLDTRRLRTQATVEPARRLQLRRDLAPRRLALPDPVPLADRPDAVPRARLRRRGGPAARGADRRPDRAGRGHARAAAHARDEPGRPLGVHALRRRRRAVRPRARHGTRDGALHRPGRARGRRPERAAPRAPRPRPHAHGAQRARASSRSSTRARSA